MARQIGIEKFASPVGSICEQELATLGHIVRCDCAAVQDGGSCGGADGDVCGRAGKFHGGVTVADDSTSRLELPARIERWIRSVDCKFQKWAIQRLERALARHRRTRIRDPQARGLQRAATIATKYLEERGLELSSEKCSLTAFTHKTMSPYVNKINGHTINYVKPNRFLGVIVDRDLSWSPHSAHVKTKLTMISHVLRFLAGKTWGASVRALLQRYTVLFLGYMRYSLPVLCGIRRTNLRVLQSIQAQALRICLGLPRCAYTDGSVSSVSSAGAVVILAAEIRILHHQAIEKQHSIVYQWIPRHCGIYGNDHADEAARSAHDGTQYTAIPFSRTDAATRLRSLARDLTLCGYSKVNTQHCYESALD
ncbi:uncharacterized protein LOC142766021 [Rhipicephalus microplus]|uniref:uncharacterized protein LOC142766021 n=1 Tax=Rhipicephalus microplus TaxID=6941 RepID=UPI003F6B8063